MGKWGKVGGVVLGILILMGIPSVHAKGRAQIARFEPWIADLSGVLGMSRNPEKVVESLLKERTRFSAFNLQALGKLYSSVDKDFEDFRRHFKSLEDGIGACEKWAGILETAKKNHAPAIELEKIAAKLKESKRKLAADLVDHGWIPKLGKKSLLEKLSQWLSSYPWDSYSEDKSRMLEALAKRLKEIKDTQFDMAILEEGNGLHEFRRQLRWFLIEARVLNGMIAFRDRSDCPIDEFKPLLNDPIASSKYSVLPFSDTEKKPCAISQCLFLGFVSAVSDLGELKDLAESANSLGTQSDRVPDFLREKAQKAYEKLVSSDLLEVTRMQIQSCQE